MTMIALSEKTIEAIVKGVIAVATAVAIHVLKSEYDRRRKLPAPRRR